MFGQYYENVILKNPKFVLIILLITLVSFGYYSKNFRLDASSETLLIEGDPDLKYLQEISQRYGSKDFLVLTYSPVSSFIEKDHPDYDLVDKSKNGQDEDVGVVKTSKFGGKDAMYISVIHQLIAKIETLETKVAVLEAA